MVVYDTPLSKCVIELPGDKFFPLQRTSLINYFACYLFVVNSSHLFQSLIPFGFSKLHLNLLKLIQKFPTSVVLFDLY